MALSSQKEWQQPHGGADVLSQDVPQTDPAEVRTLWAAVRAYNDMANYLEPMASPPGKRARTESDTLASELMPFRKRIDCSTNKSINTINLESPDFERLALVPRGILIHNQDATCRSQNPYIHFNTKEPKDCHHTKHYTSIKGLQNATIWLDPSPEFQELIIEGYNSMVQWNEVEDEFAVFAQRHLLLTEPPRRCLPKQRFWLAEAKTQIPFKIDHCHWLFPPIMEEESGYEFGWNIKPDLTYWLTLQAFNPKYRKYIQDYFFVKNDRILAPYLTVEFKRDATASRKSMNQVASAGALALYNRFILRKNAVGNNSWNADSLTDIRHYGITMEGRRYTFWILTPRTTENGEWTGLDMRWLVKESFREDDEGDGFKTFIQWLNEIHQWGMAVHGPSVQDDIKNYIKIDKNSKILPSQKDECNNIPPSQKDEQNITSPSQKDEQNTTSPSQHN